jgi:hypothetical protein
VAARQEEHLPAQATRTRTVTATEVRQAIARAQAQAQATHHRHHLHTEAVAAQAALQEEVRQAVAEHHPEDNINNLKTHKNETNYIYPCTYIIDYRRNSSGLY